MPGNVLRHVLSAGDGIAVKGLGNCCPESICRVMHPDLTQDQIEVLAREIRAKFAEWASRATNEEIHEVYSPLYAETSLDKRSLGELLRPDLLKVGQQPNTDMEGTLLYPWLVLHVGANIVVIDESRNGMKCTNRIDPRESDEALFFSPDLDRTSRYPTAVVVFTGGATKDRHFAAVCRIEPEDGPSRLHASESVADDSHRNSGTEGHPSSIPVEEAKAKARAARRSGRRRGRGGGRTGQGAELPLLGGRTAAKEANGRSMTATAPAAEPEAPAPPEMHPASAAPAPPPAADAAGAPAEAGAGTAPAEEERLADAGEAGGWGGAADCAPGAAAERQDYPLPTEGVPPGDPAAPDGMDCTGVDVGMAPPSPTGAGPEVGSGLERESEARADRELHGRRMRAARRRRRREKSRPPRQMQPSEEERTAPPHESATTASGQVCADPDSTAAPAAPAAGPAALAGVMAARGTSADSPVTPTGGPDGRLVGAAPAGAGQPSGAVDAPQGIPSPFLAQGGRVSGGGATGEERPSGSLPLAPGVPSAGAGAGTGTAGASAVEMLVRPPHVGPARWAAGARRPAPRRRRKPREERGPLQGPTRSAVALVSGALSAAATLVSGAVSAAATLFSGAVSAAATLVSGAVSAPATLFGRWVGLGGSPAADMAGAPPAPPAAVVGGGGVRVEVELPEPLGGEPGVGRVALDVPGDFRVRELKLELERCTGVPVTHVRLRPLEGGETAGHKGPRRGRKQLWAGTVADHAQQRATLRVQLQVRGGPPGGAVLSPAASPPGGPVGGGGIFPLVAGFTHLVSRPAAAIAALCAELPARVIEFLRAIRGAGPDPGPEDPAVGRDDADAPEWLDGECG